MSEINEKAKELEDRLDRLVRTQIDFQKEVSAIRAELARFGGNYPKADTTENPPRYAPPQRDVPPSFQSGPSPRRPPIRPAESSSAGFGGGPYASVDGNEVAPDPVSQFFEKHTAAARANLEKFIGENLISKIGILVLIIGIGIGVKYSIDNNLISPLTRVVLAYIFAFGLVGLAIKLKPRYLNFSAVLISGGMAAMYFVTYFAHTAYGLIGQVPAFGLMAMCTVLTVAAALFYNRQVIAHIGLVGAYAVPFLLSSDSGNYLVLFVYMAMINAGILTMSVKKYWRPIFYTASVFTWLIFLGWFGSKYSSEAHFTLAVVFLAVFFGLFLSTKIVHAVVHNERDSSEGLISTLLTVAAFYIFCGLILYDTTLLPQLWAFFIYMAAITAVLLVVSFRIFGKAVVYLCFAAAWLIFGVWFLSSYSTIDHFALALASAAALFAAFYGTAVAYRLSDESFSMVENAGLILTNSFIFYGVGYSVLDGTETGQQFLGLYTIGHSALHLGAAYFVNQVRKSAVDVVQVLAVLVLTFASIAIPVQLDGNQVTLAWSVEAALLFWFGRVRKVRLFELFAYPVMALASGSMLFDWATAYANRTLQAGEFNLQPIANGNFVTGLVFIAAFVSIFAVNRDTEKDAAIDVDLIKPFGYTVCSIALIALYNVFRTEIDNYFHLQAVNAFASGFDLLSTQFKDVYRHNAVWQINYTMAFLTAMGLVNSIRIRSFALAFVNAVPGVCVLGLFATVAMIIFYELRVGYLAGQASAWNVWIRYASYPIAALLLAALYRYTHDEWMPDKMLRPIRVYCFEAVAYTFAFIVASCELLNLMAQFGIPDGTKLGLSIFWGIYALMLVVIGIGSNRKHLRIAAIVLLAVTLMKLFFYDIADLDTIPRTILFVTLGLTLLLVSFLYNKYKNVIFGFAEESEE